MTFPTTLRDALAAAGLGGGPVEARIVAGGDISTAWQVTCDDGTDVIVKTFGTVSEGASRPPPGLYEVEAEGLIALRTIGGVRTPDVLAVTATCLVLERLHPPDDEDTRFWAR